MRTVRALLLAGLAVAVGAAPLPGQSPPLLDPSRLGDWWQSDGPVLGFYSAARVFLVSILAGWAVVALLRAAVAGTRVGTDLAGRIVNRLGAGGRRAGVAALVRLVLGLSVPGTAAAGCSTGIGTAQPAPAVSSTPAPSSAAVLPAPVLARPVLAAPVPTARVPASPVLAAPAADGPDRPDTSASTTPASRPAQARAAPPPVPASATRSTQAQSVAWTVRPGDDLWAIAAEVTARRGGRPGQVAAYWAALIEANRERLPVPSNPSLIFPGDVLVLPPPAG